MGYGFLQKFASNVARHITTQRISIVGRLNCTGGNLVRATFNADASVIHTDVAEIKPVTGSNSAAQAIIVEIQPETVSSSQNNAKEKGQQAGVAGKLAQAMPIPTEVSIADKNEEAQRETGFRVSSSAAASQIDGKSSVDSRETAKFAAIAATWWDHNGPYKPLHTMNPTRVAFVRSALCRHLRKDANNARPLEGLEIVDVGCGGGLVCEPLARMGGRVTGIDAVEENIGVASVHAARDPATASIKYLCTTAEQLVQEQKQFDVVIALEVIEHVADPQEFCKSLAALAKKDSVVLISTLNRSIAAFGLAIVGAEYILGWLPRGTHDWSKFVTPEELALLMGHASLSVDEMAGMVFNPLTQKWSLSDDTTVNYIVSGTKQGS